MYTADNICKMIEFLIDNIFVQFGGRQFRQVIGIPMGTNCAPLLADLFLNSYENEFLPQIDMEPFCTLSMIVEEIKSSYWSHILLF